MTDKAKSKTLSRQQELMRAFDFTMRDLAANREGTITESHKKALLKRERRRLLFFTRAVLIPVAVAIPILIIVVWLMFKVPLQEVLFSTSTLLWLGFLGVFTLPFMPFILWEWFSRYRVVSELNKEQIKRVQGLAVIDVSNEQLPYADVTINNIKMSAIRDAVLRIKHLEPHIVYYLPRSKIVVSVETVEE
jgi:hypothetical protein